MMARIRKAQVEDCRKIAEIMRDRSDIAFTDVDAITSRLQKNGFGEDPVFISFLAEDDDAAGASRIIGYAMVSRIYSTWQGKSLRLGDLYIVADRRRQGVGTDLLRTVMKACQEQGCARIDCCPQLANTALISFLEKHGACNIAAQDGWCYYQLAHEDMLKLAGQA
ncbi:hypothetical protein V5799_034441 [Amblyomma americanum]|uniref:N-acetyltransferase domain-containing protein n=1 Tax=Amblyomma americanum TaxID=6943 RepID=A0AAQ4DKG4_AMBAM